MGKFLRKRGIRGTKLSISAARGVYSSARRNRTSSRRGEQAGNTVSFPKTPNDSSRPDVFVVAPARLFPQQRCRRCTAVYFSFEVFFSFFRRCRGSLFFLVPDLVSARCLLLGFSSCDDGVASTQKNNNESCVNRRRRMREE